MSDLSPALTALLAEVRAIYGAGTVPLHRPVFDGSEREYVAECIDSGFVSSVGKRVDAFERQIGAFTGAGHAVATVNGTAALHIALLLAGVRRGDEVLTQALTFVATCNAVSYLGARPVFLDVDRDTLGLSPEALRRFLEQETEQGKPGGQCLTLHSAPHRHPDIDGPSEQNGRVNQRPWPSTPVA